MERVLFGFFVMLELRRHVELYKKRSWGGVFPCAGGFQVFDGLITHKILRIHEIRTGENILPFDFFWNLNAVLSVHSLEDGVDKEKDRGLET